MIQFKDVTKKYSHTNYAIKNLNVTIEDGEFVCVIGTSGSGKTTFLRMINRMVRPSSGKIIINDVDASKYNEDDLRRKIGYVIQNIGLFPHMTIRENIMIVPKLLKWTPEQQAGVAEGLIKKVELPEEFLDRKPKSLSGGQQQRVGVIRALAANQDIILMDEPFGALDPITRESLQELIKKIHREMNKTIVFVTHDMEEALSLADKVMIMAHGEIVQFDKPSVILSNPANEFVEKLLDSHNKNRFFNTQTSVKDVMQTNVSYISLSKSVVDAVKMMREKRVDTLLVVDDQKILKGFIDINDIDKNINNSSALFEIMNTKTSAVNENDSLSDVIYPLLKGKSKYLPVVDNKNHLVGILTRSSLVDIIYEELK